MKNKRKTMMIAMFTSMALLVLSGFANAASISGYTTFKEGVRSTLDMRNATVKLTSSAMVDGVLDEGSNQELFFIKADLDNGVKYSNDGYQELYYVKQPNSNNWVQMWQYSDGSVQVWDYETYDSIFDIQPEWIRIVEILGDALSGSAKDYFFASRQNGIQTVTAHLDKEQVPEIVSAAVNLLQANSIYGWEEEYIPGPDNDPNEELSEKINCGYIDNVEVTGINITAEMDENDIIRSGSLEVTILFTDKAGDTNEGVATVEFTATDVGTTNIIIPDAIVEKVPK